MKSRIIGVINILNGIAVQSVNFKKFLPIGNPKIALEYLYSWGIDEIVLLNITRNSEKNLKSVPNLLKNCFVPISIGGGINSIKDVDFLIKNGADKVIINTNLINNKITYRHIEKVWKTIFNNLNRCKEIKYRLYCFYKFRKKKYKKN